MSKAYGQRTIDTSIATERELRRHLRQNGYTIEEADAGCFTTECPVCRSTDLALHCQYFGNPHLYPRIGCRRCTATAQSVTMAIRVASVVADDRARYRSLRKRFGCYPRLSGHPTNA